MWKNTYKDYKPDEEWLQKTVEPGRGIVGCEMHEINGWGEAFHPPKPRKRGILSRLLSFFYQPKGV